MEIELSRTDPLTSLRWRWVALAAFGVLALGGGYAFLADRWSTVYAVRWLGPALLVWVYLLVSVWRGLPENVRLRDGQLLAVLGPGNVLTLLRGAAIALLAGFILLPRPSGALSWIPGILFTVVAASDFLDGYLARIHDQATLLGEKLDLQLDGLGVLVACLLAVQYRQVPVWFVGIGLARYLFLAGIRLRQQLGRPVHPLAENAARRAFAGAMTTFLAVMLWPLFSPPETHLAAILFAIPFTAGFLRDWLTVSGVIKPSIKPLAEKPGGTPTERSSKFDPARRVAFFAWAALALRLIVSGLALRAIIRQLTSSSNSFDSVLIIGLLSLGALLLLFGAAGRIGALALLFGVGLLLRQSLFSIELALLMMGTIVLFFLGTGAYSAWQPEERLINNHLGEPKRTE